MFVYEVQVYNRTSVIPEALVLGDKFQQFGGESVYFWGKMCVHWSLYIQRSNSTCSIKLCSVISLCWSTAPFITCCSHSNSNSHELMGYQYRSVNYALFLVSKIYWGRKHSSRSHTKICGDKSCKYRSNIRFVP